ncbi:MAG: ribokinase [Sedimentisphaerales bacterium]|nr:ribokinase [Sedimentisphaerales bacterium]
MNDQKQAANADNSSEGSALSSPHVVVIGSINMDMVVRAATIPMPGQTISGHHFSTVPGGKGANQAVAAARCGARVSMIGRVGNDDFGQRLLLGLKANNVDTTAVMITEGVHTGCANIIVDDNGENAICVAGGANLLLSIEDIDEQIDLITQADVIVMQLEIPQETVVYALQQAHRSKIPVILNPAPAPDVINPALFDADVLIPNQDETTRLCGEPAGDVHAAKLAGSALIGQGAKNVVITLGKRGALALNTKHISQIPPYCTSIVDTTGAGDAFCGAFAVAFTREKVGEPSGEVIASAARFAAAAGALACSKFGAQPSMPHLEAIQRLIQRSC